MLCQKQSIRSYRAMTHFIILLKNDQFLYQTQNWIYEVSVRQKCNLNDNGFHCSVLLVSCRNLVDLLLKSFEILWSFYALLGECKCNKLHLTICIQCYFHLNAISP